MARTTLVIPDDILEEVRNVAGEGSVSGFVRKAVVDRLERIKSETISREQLQERIGKLSADRLYEIRAAMDRHLWL